MRGMHDGLARYVVYTRVSTKEQGKSGLGLEAQQRDIEIFFSMRHESADEYVVLDSFLDIESGADNERKQFQAAVDMCRKTGATLVVAKLDRLSRRVSVISALMEEIHFKVASMPFADEFQLHIYAALAEQERRFISERTKKALAAAKARGVKLGGDRSGALEAANKVKQADANRNASKVAEVAQPLRDAGLTFQQIADRMNGSGLKTAAGARFTATSVKRVLDRVAA